ncbi:hypothetical protein AAZV13_14G098000 [Glycine max]
MEEASFVRRTLADRVTITGLQVYFNIARPRNNNCTTEATSDLITLLGQHAFASLANEDPFNHLATFYDLCGTIGVTQTEEENLYKRVFGFSLIGDALKWLNTCLSLSYHLE